MREYWLICAAWFLILDCPVSAQVLQNLCLWPQLDIVPVRCSADGSFVLYIKSIVMTRLVGGLANCVAAKTAAELVDCRVTLSLRDTYYQQISNQCANKAGCTLNGQGAAAPYLGTTYCGFGADNSTVRNLAAVTLQCVPGPSTTAAPTTAPNVPIVVLTSASTSVTVRTQPPATGRALIPQNPDPGEGVSVSATSLTDSTASAPVDNENTKFIVGASIGGFAAFLICAIILLILAKRGYLYRCTKYAGRIHMVEDGSMDQIEESSHGRAADQLRRMIAEEKCRTTEKHLRQESRRSSEGTARRHHRRRPRGPKESGETSRHRSRHRTERRKSHSVTLSRHRHGTSHSTGKRRARAESRRTIHYRSSGSAELLSETDAPATEEWIDIASPEVGPTSVPENDYENVEESAALGDTGRRDTRQRHRRSRVNDKSGKPSRKSKHLTKARRGHSETAEAGVEMVVSNDIATSGTSSSHRQRTKRHRERTNSSSEASSIRVLGQTADSQEISDHLIVRTEALEGLQEELSDSYQPSGRGETHEMLACSLSNPLVATGNARAQDQFVEEGALTQELQATSVSSQATDNATKRTRSGSAKKSLSTRHASTSLRSKDAHTDLAHSRDTESAQQAGEGIAPISKRRHSRKAEPTAKARHRPRQGSIPECVPNSSLGKKDGSVDDTKVGRGSKRHSGGSEQTKSKNRVSQKRTSRRQRYEMRRNEILRCSSASESEAGEDRATVAALLEQVRVASQEASRQRSEEHKRRSSAKATSSGTRSSSQTKDKKRSKTSRSSAREVDANRSRLVTETVAQSINESVESYITVTTLVETVVENQVREVTGDDDAEATAKTCQTDCSKNLADACIAPICLEKGPSQEAVTEDYLSLSTGTLCEHLPAHACNQPAETAEASTLGAHSGTSPDADGALSRRTVSVDAGYK